MTFKMFGSLIDSALSPMLTHQDIGRPVFIPNLKPPRPAGAIYGMQVFINDDVPKDQIQIKDHRGNLMGKIVNVE
jgi:hypothetical protein